MFKVILPSLNFKVERWKWNKEYRIYVSTLGHFKDEYKKNMPIKVASNGYCMVETDYGHQFVHRLVMFTFRPTPNAETLTVDHLNHNKRDNSIYNLEWVSKQENLRRAKQDLIISEGELNNFQIFAKGQFFNTFEDVIIYLHKQRKLNRGNLTKEAIKRGIIKSIKTGKTYCGIHWELK